MSRVYITVDFDIIDSTQYGKNVVSYEDAAISVEKFGGYIDTRAGIYLVPKSDVLTMESYYKYLNTMQFILHTEIAQTAKSTGRKLGEVGSKALYNTLAFLKMGFIPLVCDPTFAGGTYLNHIMPFIDNFNNDKKSDSKLPIYRRRPMSFCTLQMDLDSTDIWVHRSDCKRVLGISKDLDKITTREVLEKLGVDEFEAKL